MISSTHSRLICGMMTLTPSISFNVGMNSVVFTWSKGAPPPTATQGIMMTGNNSPVGGGAGRLRRMGLGGQHDLQVLARVGVVRLESQGFLELPDRFVGLALHAEG